MSDFTPPVSSTTEFLRPIEVFVVNPPKKRYWLHGLLLLATIFTTLVVGARMEFNFLHGLPAFSLNQNALGFFPVQWALAEPSRLLLGVPFAASLMLILLAHEMGHYLYCVHYGVHATLPFFVPAPTLIGTLGAFIRIRSPIRSRAALFDIGIAGPIAGFVVAVVVLFFSIPLSRTGFVPNPEDTQLGYPLIFKLALAVVPLGGIHARPMIGSIHFNPIAIAAWVGMFATSLNLLPGGQLDGGHIIYSLAPRVHRSISWLAVMVLIPMAIYCWAGWLLWAVLLAITGMRHPSVPSWPSLDSSRKWLALLALAMLILTLAPAPFTHGSLWAVLHQN